MSIHGFLTSVLSWYAILPAAVLCFAPMRNSLKKSATATLMKMSLTLIPLILSAGLLESAFSLGYNRS